MAGRIGDALLGADIDDHAALARRQHGRQERAHAIDRSEQIDVHGLAPLGKARVDPAPDPRHRVVGEEIDLAEPRHDLIVQPLDLLRVGNIYRHGKDRVAPARRGACNRIDGGVEMIAGEVGHGDGHAGLRKALAHAPADAECRAGHDGHVVGRND